MKHFFIIFCLLFSGLAFGQKTLTNEATEYFMQKFQDHPLHLAAFNNDVATMKSLVDAGADIQAPMDEKTEKLSPLGAAMFNGSMDAVKYILSESEYTKEEKTTYFLTAVFFENENLIQLFIDEGADIRGSALDTNAINVAAEVYNVELIQFFLDQEFDINSKDEKGNTPLLALLLFLAQDNDPASKMFNRDENEERQKQGKAFQFLLDKGAKLDVKDKRGYTPLHVASDSGFLVAVQGLLARGVDINAKNDNGVTPLYLSVVRNNVEVTQALIEAGANVNARNKDGFTILDVVLVKAEDEDTALNVLRNAVLGVENKDYTAIIEFLEQNGAEESSLWDRVRRAF